MHLNLAIEAILPDNADLEEVKEAVTRAIIAAGSTEPSPSTDGAACVRSLSGTVTI